MSHTDEPGFLISVSTVFSAACVHDEKYVSH